MMGGPIDTREAPTAVNTLATQRPHAWFQQNAIVTVPMTYPGAGRQVYPGFLQLAGFMSMNLGNHMISHFELFKHLVAGDGESADATKDFYDEYRSVCDMTAEFYLQTVDLVFQTHALPNGTMTHRGRPVDPTRDHRRRADGDRGRARRYFGAGTDQGGADAGEQAVAEQKNYLMADAGHYGIFNGSKWRDQIAPRWRSGSPSTTDAPGARRRRCAVQDLGRRSSRPWRGCRFRRGLIVPPKSILTLPLSDMSVSHNSALSMSKRSSARLGSSLPPGNQASTCLFHSLSICARSLSTA